jgi:predicted nucleic acid-binding protein
MAETELSEDLKTEPDGAIAVDVMRQNGITEIYSYDEDFDNIENITRRSRT